VSERTPALETGNAADAGAVTRGWFVGDLADWAAARGERLDPSSTPRQSLDVQVKWFVHPPGHVRPAWADPDTHYSLGLLVDGDMHFGFRDLDGAEQSIALTRSGDYVLWHGPSYAHTWRSKGGCTFLTVRWPVRAGKETGAT
jgi:hypothetical protein